MKSNKLSRSSGFTLIELLVVITIIAVLAGLAIPTANIVLDRAKQVQARAGANGLVIAAKAYQTEYNRLPNPSANAGGGTTPETPIDTDSGNDMISTLLAKNDTYNPRQISFYDPPIAKGEANGLIAEDSKYEVVDPWSRPGARQYYHMVFDYDGDGKIKNPVKQDSDKYNPAYISAEPEDLTTAVAVYSEGNPKVTASSRKPLTSW